MQEHNGSSDHRVRLSLMATEACKTDNVSLMAEAISLALTPGSNMTVDKVIKKGLRLSIARAATRTLSYLLEEQAADVETITPSDLVNKEKLAEPSREVLNILLNHGWDINSQGPNRNNWPLLWFMTRYPDLLEWCLERGANVTLPSSASCKDTNMSSRPPPILDLAVTNTTVATFERLRAKGAPLSGRVLHKAVDYAALHAPKNVSIRSKLFEQRMDMVRHLVETLELDVNAEQRWPGTACGTPLCHVACRNNGRDVRELVWYLLSRGANPNHGGGFVQHLRYLNALECARSSRNESFLRAVEEWQAQQYENAIQGASFSISEQRD